jgi:hypothetical protein
MSKQANEIISRRKIITSGGLLAGSAAFVAGTGLAGTAAAQGGTYTESAARQDVEYLRRWYGIATDLLARDDPGDFNTARKIYRRIFKATAIITIGGNPFVDPTLGTSPDQWATFVRSVLNSSLATQHLLGTQVFEIDVLPSTSPAQGASTGHATGSTYLQAWQTFPSDAGAGSLSLFIGTYFDKVQVVTLRSGQQGWQIYDMNLVRASGESRVLDPT